MTILFLSGSVPIFPGINNFSIFGYKNSPAKSLGVKFYIIMNLSLVFDKRNLKISEVGLSYCCVSFKIKIEDIL